MNRKTSIVAQIFAILLLIGYSACMSSPKEKATPVDYVNPYIGNISHLLVPTYPTIHLPNSMMRVHPLREDFTGTQLHGLPVFLPTHRGHHVFNLLPFQGNTDDFLSVRAYDYDSEIVKPYYYEVYLDNVNTAVKFVPAHQAAVYELNFQGKDVPQLIINAEKGTLHAVANTVSGWQFIRNSQTKVYLYLETDQFPVETTVSQADENVDVKLQFDLAARTVNVRYCPLSHLRTDGEDFRRLQLLQRFRQYGT
ncbi:hypothetical protein FACS1894176_09140 [Bacteroidia bacterium]|nr:hypothetical protein FACS1894176_09140 [Bacteroidia bacterium]